MNMYRVVLVDDDVMVTEFLQAAIDWDDFNFQVAGCFQDGEEALDYLEKHTVDLLITDIGMPFMNGIELLTHVTDKKLATVNVVLSCHDEFHFAQKAIKLGTFDYILKESMEEDMLIELLLKIKAKLDDEKATKHREEKMEQFLHENKTALKSKFIEEVLLDHFKPTEEWWRQQEQLLDIRFSSERYTVALCFIDDYKQVQAKYEKESLLHFSIHNLLEDVCQSPLKVEAFYLKGTFFLLFATDHKSSLNMREKIQKTLASLQHSLETYLKMTMTAVIGEENEQRDELVYSMRMLNRHKEQRFYYPHRSIQTFTLMSYTEESIFQDYYEHHETLKQLILEKNRHGTKTFFSEKMQQMKQMQIHPSIVKDWAMKLILDLKLSLKVLGQFEMSVDKIMTDQLIQPAETCSELEAVMNGCVVKMIDYVDIIEATPKNEEVFKAQRFVLEHMNQKITLSDVANHLHLNASYFSRMFKKETGESFIEFVTRIKMEKAKDMLNHTIKPVEQIALDVGFDNKSYFFRTFKKQFGVTPSEYKYRGVVRNAIELG